MIFNAEKCQQQCNLGEEQNRERFSLTMTKSPCSEEDPASILLRRNHLHSILRWRGQREREKQHPAILVRRNRPAGLNTEEGMAVGDGDAMQRLRIRVEEVR
jgi:hypothetical protein